MSIFNLAVGSPVSARELLNPRIIRRDYGLGCVFLSASYPAAAGTERFINPAARDKWPLNVFRPDAVLASSPLAFGSSQCFGTVNWNGTHDGAAI